MHFSNANNNESAPRRSGSGSARSPATRGLFIPAYREPEHYALRQRPSNPPLTLPSIRQRSTGAPQVIVRFYHCENFNFGNATLTSPDVRSLLSEAVAFLGECQIMDTPETSLPPRLNPAYRGLTLQGSHGGYHLHYPDHAGARPYHGDVAEDWNRVMSDHARDFPTTALLVGVGLGQPGRKCCLRQ
ncbi:hypothetical protein F5B22DRAFT_658967 [Xylaria bambusicola]|uniref:uncharacterized protein n=1 Tax=Xylaria bambusicola TaxID=326684 RepID=UPI002007F170|nr:uncharacterized protein F5B22DRAFT_658967 [Xylaria bambusicola]KAI0508650.1 hypothetical protein F5B22DRAFT_658967 [Xylaria bambusicola]